MKRSLLNIKIPTLAGLFILIAAVTITVLLTGDNKLFDIRANPSITPSFIRIGNITDNSFTVSYVTAQSTTGSLSYGETSGVGQIVLDDRDKGSGEPLTHQVHYFTLTNLKPKTQYYFTILSGGTSFNDQGSPYSTVTGATLTANSGNQKTVQGMVQMPDGKIPKEAIAHMQTSSSQLMSAPVQPDGSYRFELSMLRGQNLEQYAVISDTDQINLTFFGDGLQTTATTLLKDSAAVPAVTLSQQYSFTAGVPVTPTIAGGLPQPTSAQLPTNPVGQPTGNLEILVPQQNQDFTDSKPELSGTALPNSSADIYIQAAVEIKATVPVNANGEWNFRPTTALEPGIYTLTVTGKNASGSTQTISESFIVYAPGSGFTDPSVSPLKPSPSPTGIPTTIPTIIPTTLPTSAPIASASATPSPTAPVPTATVFVPSPTVIAISSAMPSAQPSIVPPGSNEMFAVLGFIAFATIASALLFFLIHV